MVVPARAQDRARLAGGGAATALAATPTLLFVADARGHVHTLRCEIRAGALQGLVHLARRRAPEGGWYGRPACADRLCCGHGRHGDAGAGSRS
jgi:hypothetical protein